MRHPTLITDHFDVDFLEIDITDPRQTMLIPNQTQIPNYGGSYRYARLPIEKSSVIIIDPTSILDLAILNPNSLAEEIVISTVYLCIPVKK